MPDPRSAQAADIVTRKADHLELAVSGDVGFVGKGPLFEEVDFVHDALPELHADELDVSVPWLGQRLRAPLVIAAMTGGTPAAAAINRDLARAAEAHGVGFNFGSMRPLLRHGVTDGYLVRDVAPTALLVANLGGVQAAETPTATVRELLDRTGSNALAIHLNPAQEMAQPGGDRDFRGVLAGIRRIVEELGAPVLVKETGAGLSRRVVERLLGAGVGWVDVGGAGGTSWVAVEMHRAEGAQAAAARTFRDWGIPTAAAVARLRGMPVEVCATGGVATGLDVARALALGATCAGIARPLLQAQALGYEALDRALGQVVAELRMAMVLTGSANLAALRQAPVALGPRLRAYLE